MNTIIVSLSYLRDLLWGWPTIVFVLFVGGLCTVMFHFVQLRYFFTVWSYLFKSEEAIETREKKGDMTSFQAFLNTLSANLGNGSIAGVATPIYAGGPGTLLWMVIIGLLLSSVRFAEVFLSVQAGMEKKTTSSLGGPMLYLRDVPYIGTVLASLYGFGVLIFSFVLGNALQTNSIRVSAEQTWGISPLIVAIIASLFIIYVLFGGAKRIVQVSEYIVPLKVGTFFMTTFLVLGYHWKHLGAALKLIVVSGLSSQAAWGGVMGFTVIQAMRFGISRSIFATEAGLGTAAILFGSTNSNNAVKDSIVAMLSTFISTLACFIIGLCIVVTGVWNNGMTSTALTIASYQTVFGAAAGWLVSFLSISFGIGVFVAFAYITRSAWLFVTSGRFELLFVLCYTAVAFIGAMVDVELVFAFGDIANAFILILNLFGILWLTMKPRRALEFFEKTL
ncbi:MAG: alanine:cation symporter family protein [Candidatus Babeliales bacterium]